MSLAFYVNVLIGGLLTGLVYGLASLGLAMIIRVTRVVNFAHGAMMVAGLLAATLPIASRSMDPLMALPPVALGLFIFGFVIQWSLISRLPELPQSCRLLFMVGIAMMAASGLSALFRFGGSGTLLPVALDNLAAANLAAGSFQVDQVRVHAALVAVMVTGGLIFFFNVSRTGKAISACSDSPLGALVIGLDLEWLQAVGFGLGSALTGIAGCLLANTVVVRPTLVQDFTVIGFIIILIGGIDSVGGALAGGMLVGMTEAMAGTLLGPEMKELSAYLLLVLVLLLRPHGLGGRAE
ncbi:MAG: branched-chain amino acid ABC transporter permease [Rhodospirillaceae bacterium]